MSRRKPRAASLAGLLLLAATLAGCGSAGTTAAPDRALGPAQWTRFAGNPENNAVFEQGAARNLSVSWHTAVPGSPDMLSLVGGVLYAGGTTPPYKVYAFDVRTGQQLWSTVVDNQIETTPLYADGRLFVGSGNRDWVNPAPTFDLESTNLVRGTGSNSLIALSAATGKVLWTLPTAGENKPTPVYRGGVLYAVGGDGLVRAVDAATGLILWRLQLPSYVSMSSPTLLGNLLIFGGAHPYTMYAVNVATHKLAWQVPVPQSIGGLDDCSPAASGGIVVTEASVGRWGGKHVSDEVLALSPATGKMLWERTLSTGTSMPVNMETSPPVIDQGVIYISAPVARQTYALRLSDGSVLWHIRTKAMVKSAPTVYNGVLDLADVQGNLYRIDARTGRILGVRPLGGLVANNYPLLVGHTLLVSDSKTGLWALPNP